MLKSHPWIESSDVLSIFPTLVWKIALAVQARDSVNVKIREALDRIGPPATELTPGKGWQSAQTLHTLDEFREFVACIEDVVQIILRFLKTGYGAFEVTGCWANINPPGASHRMHSHPNNYLSGVYYVQTPSGADTINFHDPRIQTDIIRPPVTELTAENTDQVVVQVSSGTLLLFPAYLQHSVDPNRSERERISVSFNIMFSDFTENLSKPLW